MSMRRSGVVLPWAALLVLVLPSPARAQGAEPTRQLTAEQLDSFVELTGDPKPLVWQRLLADPGLVPYAAAAANARLARRASGKTMTIAGFTILGVGAALGYGMVLWGLTSGIDCGAYSDCSPDETLILGGFALMVGSIATGCGIGVPGIIRMVRASEAENEASARYQYPGLPPGPAYPPPYRTSSRWPPAGRTLSAPILSLTF
jgi:hypothetical protein